MKLGVKELRIGNLIYWNGVDIKVNTHHLSVIDTGKEPFYSRYKPIPLTEEWLLKFGWGCSDDGEYCNNVVLKDAVLMYDVHTNYFELSLNKDDFAIKLHYVHQLQNLYFSLTGEELTIKN